MEPLFIGIDIGTSSVKLVLADETGIVVKKASAEYQVEHPQAEWSEIEPDVWFRAVLKCMDEIFEGSDRSKIKGIGVTGQMHTTVFLDNDGNSIRPALLWTDKRTKQYLPFLKEQISNCTKISYIADIISIGSPAVNLYWLKKKEPENFLKLHKFLIGPDYIVYRFTGTIGTEYCEASTSSLFDLRVKRWSQDMRKIIGLRENIYPQVRGSAQTAGTLCSDMAEKFGLNQDVRVIVGTGDNPAAAITTGCLGHGYPVISLGTSGVFMLKRKQPDFKTRGKNILLSFDNEKFFYLVQGTVQSAGSALNWWMKSILGISNMSQIDEKIDISTAGKSRLIFYPHIQGDKTLYADPNLSGAFFGLRSLHTSWDMVYAVMEGICFAFKELSSKMGFGRSSFESIRIIGGGSKSEVWMQTMADVLNIQIDQLDGEISASLGSALLCAYSCGRINDLSDITDRVTKIRRSFRPRPKYRTMFDKKYSMYLKIHAAMIDVFERQG